MKRKNLSVSLLLSLFIVVIIITIIITIIKASDSTGMQLIAGQWADYLGGQGACYISTSG